jgi:hypothetical protein
VLGVSGLDPAFPLNVPGRVTSPNAYLQSKTDETLTVLSSLLETGASHETLNSPWLTFCAANRPVSTRISRKAWDLNYLCSTMYASPRSLTPPWP